MVNFEGINNIMSRIKAIQARFCPPVNSAPILSEGQIPFDVNLKMALGAQNMMQVGLNEGPASVEAFYQKLGAAAQLGAGGATSAAGERIVQIAKQWEGKEFKAGLTHRCADFVSTMIESAGVAPPNFKHEENCFNLQQYGREVAKADLKPGDIVYFSNTYMPATYTHVGIYLGDGKFIHRPTADKPVVVDSLDSGYYAEKYESARRLVG